MSRFFTKSNTSISSSVHLAATILTLRSHPCWAWPGTGSPQCWPRSRWWWPRRPGGTGSVTGTGWGPVGGSGGGYNICGCVTEKWGGLVRVVLVNVLTFTKEQNRPIFFLLCALLRKGETELVNLMCLVNDGPVFIVGVTGGGGQINSACLSRASTHPFMHVYTATKLLSRWRLAMELEIVKNGKLASTRSSSWIVSRIFFFFEFFVVGCTCTS